jgi:hypothetical protein
VNYIAESMRTADDVVYPHTRVPAFGTDGKALVSWMADWPLGDRIEKFFEFCRAYDLRRDDLLAGNYQQFSHRLHWDECPFIDRLRGVNDPARILYACILFSFTNEKWDTFLQAFGGGSASLREWVTVGSNRHSRHDLFQIYFPKGTDVLEWLCTVPETAAEALSESVVDLKGPHSMMGYAKLLNRYFTGKPGFRNAMYPCKNVARHVAMGHPGLVDPDSFLHGGTGFFEGLNQVFDCGNLMPRAKYDIVDGEYVPINEACRDLVWYMDLLRDHTSSPIKRHKYLNLEDKLCMFNKHIGMRHGVKRQTKQVPYDWVYPNDWSLVTGEYR